jgi:hypothetical protein
VHDVLEERVEKHLNSESESEELLSNDNEEGETIFSRGLSFVVVAVILGLFGAGLVKKQEKTKKKKA